MNIRIHKETESIFVLYESHGPGFQRSMLEVSELGLPHEWEQRGNDTCLIYHHGTKTTLSLWVREERTGEDIRRFCKALIELEDALDRYLLQGGEVIFDPNWIEWDAEEGKISVVYIPYIHRTFSGLWCVPLWTRLARYLHQKEVMGQLTGPGVREAIFELEQAAFRRQQKDPAWAGSWVEQEERTLEKREEETTPGKDENVPKVSREEALDQLIKAHEEQELSLSQFFRKSFRKIRNNLPIGFKD